jgi:hypothetical protein
MSSMGPAEHGRCLANNGRRGLSCGRMAAGTWRPPLPGPGRRHRGSSLALMDAIREGGAEGGPGGRAKHLQPPVTEATL